MCCFLGLYPIWREAPRQLCFKRKVNLKSNVVIPRMLFYTPHPSGDNSVASARTPGPVELRWSTLRAQNPWSLTTDVSSRSHKARPWLDVIWSYRSSLEVRYLTLIMLRAQTCPHYWKNLYFFVIHSKCFFMLLCKHFNEKMQVKKTRQPTEPGICCSESQLLSDTATLLLSLVLNIGTSKTANYR